MKRVFAACLFVTISSIATLAQTESRADLQNVIETKRAELAKLEAIFLEPAAEDRTAYSEFLSQPDTGLIRLLPREKFDSYGEGKTGLTINGGGAYYSFARLTHEYGQGSDISLQQGHLRVGFAGADYGMLIKLDGATFENISTELPEARFLTNYKAVGTEPEARVEQRRFLYGADIIGGFAYQGRVKVEIGATYLLRSISFERSDLLVAVKVVRQDTDGSVILAWKLLQKYSVPKLARNTQPEQPK
jgi:hypothetical protein